MKIRQPAVQKETDPKEAKSAHLRGIEEKVDQVLASLPRERRAPAYQFEIERDKNGLLKRVVARPKGHSLMG